MIDEMIILVVIFLPIIGFGLWVSLFEKYPEAKE